MILYSTFFIIIFYFIIPRSSAQNIELFQPINIKLIEDVFADNNINFLHVYNTHGCGNEKIQQMFTNTDVINFFSSNFKCFSISIDSILNNNIFNLTRSGFYFIDSSFSLIHKHLVSPRSPDDLIKVGETALDSTSNYKSIMNKYKQGTRNFPFIMQYLKLRINAQEITSGDIDEAVSHLDTSNILSYETMKFIYDYFF